jgi:hypothetical protein
MGHNSTFLLVNVCLVAQLIKKNTPPYLKMIISRLSLIVAMKQEIWKA